jgi:hypothetical protein
MSDSQPALSEFDGKTARTKPEPADTPPEPISIPSHSQFESAGGEYPDSQIGALTDGSTISVSLCIPKGTVSVTFTHLAGSGGMGPTAEIDNRDEVAGLLDQLKGHPLLVTGGGMNTPMGCGFVLGRLTDTRAVDATVEVEYRELFRHSKRSRDTTETKRLGSYQVFVPKTDHDSQRAAKALTHWEAGELEHLNPEKRAQEKAKEQHQEAFDSLSPGDKIETPEYATRLDVISEPYETHAVIPRGTLGEKTVSVTAVVVANPRGGYYQIGMNPNSNSRYMDGPTCYMSGSKQTPPTPNTAFTRDVRFSCGDIDITTIEHPPDPTIIEPDAAVLESPLPEPRLQTALDSLDGIGEKTSRKIQRLADQRVTAETLAWSLFGDGETHTESHREIENTLKSLPKHEQIYDQLQKYTPE